LPDALGAHADDLGHGHVHAHHPAHQHHFETMEQQAEAATLGMWIFLVTEVMFFGGLLTAYLIYRVWYPAAWAEGSRELSIALGGTNTAVLICSSLTMALAVRCAQTGARKTSMTMIVLTMLLGMTFLVIKFFEYREKWLLGHVPGPYFDGSKFGGHAPQIEIFLSLYFSLTGLHALHMIIGLGLMTVMLWMTYKNRFSPEWYTPMELSGLYWHFVDIVWIFLFPLLYLVDRAGHFA
jgi:cytochrome c oxidase subunit 3